MFGLLRSLFSKSPINWEELAMTRIESEAALEAVLAQSTEGPVFLFKHSTTCPVSARAFAQVKMLSESGCAVPIFVVLVIENRPISLSLAEKVQLKHESPQLLLIHRGKCVWHASHGGITESAALRAAERVLQEEG